MAAWFCRARSRRGYGGPRPVDGPVRSGSSSGVRRLPRSDHHGGQGDGQMGGEGPRGGKKGGVSPTVFGLLTATLACRVRRVEICPSCERVRIARFVDGLPCSIHGIVFDEYVAVVRPVELIVLRSPTAGFVYAGTATYWDPPAPDRVAKTVVARADAHRGGAAYLPVPRDISVTRSFDLVCAGGWRLAEPGEEPDARLELGLPRAVRAVSYAFGPNPPERPSGHHSRTASPRCSPSPTASSTSVSAHSTHRLSRPEVDERGAARCRSRTRARTV